MTKCMVEFMAWRVLEKNRVVPDYTIRLSNEKKPGCVGYRGVNRLNYPIMWVSFLRIPIN